MPIMFNDFKNYFKAGKGEKTMILPKDLLNDLDSEDRTIEMLSIDWTRRQELAGNLIYTRLGGTAWR